MTLSLEAQYQPTKHCEAQLDVCGGDADDDQTVGHVTLLHSPGKDSDGVNSARTCRLAFPSVAGM